MASVIEHDPTTYEPPQPEHKVAPGLSVIHGSLFRMGTKSMTAAYRILGYRVDHGMDTLEQPWAALEAAAEATFPHAPGAVSRPPYTRKEWDELWGNRVDIVTDLGSIFCPEFVKAYPDAKLVIVQREFDSWYKSLSEGPLHALFGPVTPVLRFLALNVLNNRAFVAMHKIFLGFFHARDRAEIDVKAREVYDRYFAELRAAVPPENILEYKLGDGWEPLCEFLGKPVPNTPFPRLNDAASHSNHTRFRYMRVVKKSAKTVGPYAAAALSIGAAIYASSNLR
ncbi:hypothetical protein F5Y18DRAFT_29874 [Xylariaceae sp. FL1019]|nr:hypothetical protein F5Y18DRAFT_29874 [Xylariaceae sp. FL1019]